MESNLTGICIHYNPSINQRKAETARGLNYDGTEGYAEEGCYSCDGFNPFCKKRMSIKELMEK